MDFLLPSFTPVRRPENSVNNRLSRGDLQKEWTANRCHRLLRPLTSRIAILDKQVSCFPCADHVSKRQRRSGSIRAIEECHDEEDPEASDAEWTHQPARKRIRRTYSTRRGGKDKSNHGNGRRGPKSDVQIAAPGEITVPTPVLNRTSKNINTVVVPIEGESFRVVRRSKPRYLGQDGEAYSQLAQIRKTTAASRYSTYEGIFNGLEALLKATAPDSLEKKKTGISSLFLTCLKTIPTYIAEEQAIISAEAESIGCKSAIDRRDISSEIYDDLESLGTSNLGWKHLKTVVRSHGIKVVSDAIERRLLDVQCCGALATLCVQLDSLDAAESILSSILSVSQIPNPKTVHSKFGDDTAAQAVSMLWRFVELTGRTSFQYRQLSRMFATGSLPLVWLATKEFGPIWTGVIQSLSSGPDTVDALAFINTTLPLLARPELVQKTEWHGLTDENKDLADALQQTYSSVLTTISTIAILSREAARKLHTGDSHTNFEPSTPEHDVVVTLLHDCIVSCKLSFQEPSSSSALLLVSILAIVSGDKGIACGSYAFLIDLLLSQLRRNVSRSGLSSAYSGIVTFICSIARCCGRGASTSGLEYLQQLHRILEAPRSSNAPDESDILIEIIVDSAFAFAQQAPDRKHLTYAEDINTRYHQGCNPQTKEELAGNLHTGNNGFRWEEGISEWVTATPAANLKKSKLIGHYDLLEEFEYDTPFRPIYKKASRENVPQTKSTRATRSLQHKIFLDSEDNQVHLPKVASSDGLMEPIALVSPLQTSSQTTHSDRGYISSGNKRKLRSSQTFQILEDDSDDELSFLSSASQEDRKVLRVVTNTASTGTRRSSQTKSWMTQSRSTIRQRVPVLEDSEDELCI